MNLANTLRNAAASTPKVCNFCGKPLKTTTVTVNGKEFGGLPTYGSCGCESSRKYYESLGKPKVQSPLAKYRKAGVPEKFLEASDDVSRFVGELRRGMSLYIHGGFGEGKTRTASIVAMQLIDLGHSVKFESTDAIIDGKFSDSAYLDSLQNCDFLFLDDLGKEANSAWAVSVMWEIINQRYLDGKPICVTTNYNRAELARRMAEKGDRNTSMAIASRLNENTVVVETDGIDRRTVERAG